MARYVDIDAFKITPNFTLGEFSVSATYPHLAKPVPPEYGPNVVKLATTIMQPLRDYIGRPVLITSGYRTAALNKALGGSSTSQHLRAEAADVTFPDLWSVFLALRGRQFELPVGQVIIYPDQDFMHMALPNERYPEPSFFVHWPDSGFRYWPVTTKSDWQHVMVRLVTSKLLPAGG